MDMAEFSQLLVSWVSIGFMAGALITGATSAVVAVCRTFFRIAGGKE